MKLNSTFLNFLLALVVAVSAMHVSAQDLFYDYFAPEGTQWYYNFCSQTDEYDQMLDCSFDCELKGEVFINGKKYYTLKNNGDVFAMLRLDENMFLYYRDITGQEKVIYDYSSNTIDGDNTIDFYIENGLIHNLFYSYDVELGNLNSFDSQEWHYGVGPKYGLYNLYRPMYNTDKKVPVLKYANNQYINSVSVDEAEKISIHANQNQLIVIGSLNTIHNQSYSIYSLTGQLLQKGDLQNSLVVDISSLVNGLYVFRANNQSLKFLK